MKRDIVFLVADKNMEEVFAAFLGRENAHRSLGCGEFRFDRKLDLHRHPRKDPGVYNEAHVFLEPFRDKYHCAVVVMDADWEGSPGAESIAEAISANMDGKWDRFAVIIIDPELECWIWVSHRGAKTVEVHPAVVEAFRYNNNPPLHELLQTNDNWDGERNKPVRPKEAAEEILRRTRTPRSSSLYTKIVERVTIKGCNDAAFLALLGKLRQWYPPGANR